MLRTDLLNQLVQFVEIDIALERMPAGRIVCLVDYDVDKGAACQFLMKTGGGEIHIAGYVVTLFDQNL